MMNLKNEITTWNGKSAEAILAIYHRHCTKSTFASNIVSLMEQIPLQNGATWLLKKHFENKKTIDTNTISQIYSLLPTLDHWESKLHILQCLPFMPIDGTNKPTVETFLRECLTEKNKLVRAWAYNGFHKLALQYPEYESEKENLFEAAMQGEAASVKARIRNIQKEEAAWVKSTIRQSMKK